MTGIEKQMDNTNLQFFRLTVKLLKLNNVKYEIPSLAYVYILLGTCIPDVNQASLILQGYSIMFGYFSSLVYSMRKKIE